MARRDTRKQIILAAERLFAERGLAGVSLREINVAAGQRNTSAAHYHFGSKESLVEAIFEFRRAAIGRRRDELLDSFERDKTQDVRQLARGLVEPLAAELRGEEPSYYLAFLAHLYLQSPEEVGSILQRHEAGERRWAQLCEQALPNIPRDLLFARLYLMGRHVVVSLAAYQRRGLGSAGTDFDVYLSNMLDAVAGYIGAPCSAETNELVGRRQAERSTREPGSPT